MEKEHAEWPKVSVLEAKFIKSILNKFIHHLAVFNSSRIFFIRRYDDNIGIIFNQQ